MSRKHLSSDSSSVEEDNSREDNSSEAETTTTDESQSEDDVSQSGSGSDEEERKKGSDEDEESGSGDDEENASGEGEESVSGEDEEEASEEGEVSGKSSSSTSSGSSSSEEDETSSKSSKSSSVSGFSSGDEEEEEITSSKNVRKELSALKRKLEKQSVIRVFVPEDTSLDEELEIYRKAARCAPLVGSNKDVLNCRPLYELESVASRLALLLGVAFEPPLEESSEKKGYYVNKLAKYPQSVLFLLSDDLREEIKRESSEMTEKDKEEKDALDRKIAKINLLRLSPEEEKEYSNPETSSSRLEELEERKKEYNEALLTKEENRRYSQLTRPFLKLLTRKQEEELKSLASKQRTEKENKKYLYLQKLAEPKAYTNALAQRYNQVQYMINELSKPTTDTKERFIHLVTKSLEDVAPEDKRVVSEQYSKIRTLTEKKDENPNYEQDVEGLSKLIEKAINRSVHGSSVQKNEIARFKSFLSGADLEARLKMLRNKFLTSPERKELGGILKEHGIGERNYSKARRILYDVKKLSRPFTINQEEFINSLFLKKSKILEKKVKTRSKIRHPTKQPKNVLKKSKIKVPKKSKGFEKTWEAIQNPVDIFVREKEIKPSEKYNKTQQMILDAILARMKNPSDTSVTSTTISFAQTKPTQTTIWDRVDLKKVQSLISAFKSRGLEVEVSFGKFERKGDRYHFRPGVSAFAFSLLQNLYEQVKPVVSQSRVETVQVDQYTVIRKITQDEETIYQTKTKKAKFNIEDYGLRLNISTEVEANKEDFETLEGRRFIRNRVRYSFQLDNSRLDLTQVEEIVDDHSYRKYEVEVEMNNEVTLTNYTNEVLDVLLMTQKASSINQLTFEHPTFAYTKTNNPRNVKLFNLWSPSFQNIVATVKLNGIQTRIVVLKGSVYAVFPGHGGDVWKLGTSTLKDSEFLSEFMMKENEFQVFDVLNYEGESMLEKVWTERNSKVPTLISSSKSRIPLKTKEMFSSERGYENIKCALKARETQNNDGIILYSTGTYRAPIWKWKPEDQLTIDFLFKKANVEEIRAFAGIKSEKAAKAKVGQLFLLLVKNSDRHAEHKYVPFEGSRKNPFEKAVASLSFLPEGKFQDQNPDGLVIECASKEKGGIRTFFPIRIRQDKKEPNSYETASDVYDDIVNPVSERMVAGYGMELMRKFHMGMKERMCQEYIRPEERILDIGTGRGGMLNVFERLKPEQVLAVEPNKEFSTELKRRLGEMDEEFQDKVKLLPFGAEYTERLEEEGDIPVPSSGLKEGKEDTFNAQMDAFAANPFATQVSAAPKAMNLFEKTDVAKELDVITAFFSLTFFYKDQKKLSGLLNTLSLVKQDGYVIGAVMDGVEVKKLMRNEGKYVGYEESKCDSESETTTSFVLTKGKTTKTVFGNEVFVQLNDETTMVKEGYLEYEFDFDDFASKMKKRGFSLVFKSSIDEKFDHKHFGFEFLPTESKVFSKANIAFAFKKDFGSKALKTEEKKETKSKRVAKKGKKQGK